MLRVVPWMAAQTEECRWLLQKVVGHRSMWIMASVAVLADWRMLEGKRPLLLRVAFVANQIDGRLLEIACFLTVRIVAIGANHLSFLDGMVGRKRIEAIDLLVALVASGGFVDRHLPTTGSRDARAVPMIDVHNLRHARARVRIVAVGAGHAVLMMCRRMPCHRRGAGVAFQAEILSGLFDDLPVRVMTGRAIKAVGPADLVRSGDLLVVLHVGMAAEADSRRDGAQVIGHSSKRRQLGLLVAGPVCRAFPCWRIGRRQEGGRHNLRALVALRRVVGR